MKIKTSITLSEEVLRSIDSLLVKHKNRSELIEKALRDYLERQAVKERDARDLEILNKKAARLNREAEDVLSYQVDL